MGEHAFDIETYTRSGICDPYRHIGICHTGSFLATIDFNENLHAYSAAQSGREALRALSRADADCHPGTLK